MKIIGGFFHPLPHAGYSFGHVLYSVVSLHSSEMVIFIQYHVMLIRQVNAVLYRVSQKGSKFN